MLAVSAATDRKSLGIVTPHSATDYQMHLRRSGNARALLDLMWEIGPVPTGILGCQAGRSRPYIIIENALKVTKTQSPSHAMEGTDAGATPTLGEARDRRGDVRSELEVDPGGKSLSPEVG